MEDYLFKFEENDKITPIVNEFVIDYPSVTDRFFTRYYKIFVDFPGEDHLILFHSNRICLLSLAKKHVALKKGISKVRYDIGNMDRGENTVKGKRKKGGMPLQPNSTVAIVECNDGSAYRIQSCITGKLLEINQKLLVNPKLLEVDGDGYIAIILPKKEDCENIKNNLFSHTQYEMLRTD